MNPEIFRTYDIRGIADVDLTNEAVEILGKSYGTFLPSNAKRIGIGRDIRLSSERIKNNFVKGLLSTGLNVIDFSVIPTPLLYFSVHKYGLDGGVVITGSHNPEKYNGLKILVSKDTIYGEEIQEIRRIADKSVFRKGSGSYEERDIEGEYIDDILGRISPGKRKLKIVFDAGNGTTGPVTKRLYSKLSFEFEILFSEPDGSFTKHIPSTTSPEYRQDLSIRVKKSKADI